MTKPIQQAGFTLVELMISIVLGLLITAAGLAIFFAGQRSLAMQNGMSELQQNSIFGLAMVTHDMRHMNLNTTANLAIHPDVPGAGIILSQRNLPKLNANFLTKIAVHDGLMDVKNDQLTIQYLPQYLKNSSNKYMSHFVDCEGRELTNLDHQQAIVQRYYIREENGQSGLYCDAGYYNYDAKQISTIEVFGLAEKAGQLIIPHAEAFKIRLGIKNTNNTLKTDDDRFYYQNINDYVTETLTAGTNSITAMTKPELQVVAVEMGVVTRSTNPVGADTAINSARDFNIAGQTVKLKNPPEATDTKYLREEFSQVVALRNAEGLNK